MTKFIRIYQSNRGIWRCEIERDSKRFWFSLRTKDENVARREAERLRAGYDQPIHTAAPMTHPTKKTLAVDMQREVNDKFMQQKLMNEPTKEAIEAANNFIPTKMGQALVIALATAFDAFAAQRVAEAEAIVELWEPLSFRWNGMPYDPQALKDIILHNIHSLKEPRPMTEPTKL